jgi:hypothetical protein
LPAVVLAPVALLAVLAETQKNYSKMLLQVLLAVVLARTC